MNIVVLGATSAIGSEIAAIFAQGNSLVLCARNSSRLDEAARLCSERGARKVVTANASSEQGWEAIASHLPKDDIDLLINAASATSRLRDSEIPSDKLYEFISADVLWPVQLVDRILSRQRRRHLSIVFVSSILALVRSPNRKIYSALKQLQEVTLQSIVSTRPGVSLLVVHVGKVLPPNKRTPETKRLAQAVFHAVAKRKKVLVYGALGKLSVILFNAQPLLFDLAIRLRRLFSARY
jgi:NAD(P)-dependent dehydrogenase (short-subunit alcohol dehydrogenase family)